MSNSYETTGAWIGLVGLIWLLAHDTSGMIRRRHVNLAVVARMVIALAFMLATAFDIYHGQANGGIYWFLLFCFFVAVAIKGLAWIARRLFKAFHQPPAPHQPAPEEGGAAYLKDRDNPGQDLVINGRKFRYEIFVHGDGGVVRLKPDGDPQNPVPARRVPHAVKSVQLVPGPDTSFGNEAFKVDDEGNPMPKCPADLARPFPVGTPEAETFINDVMNLVHMDLG